MAAAKIIQKPLQTLAIRGTAGIGLLALVGCAVSNEGAVDYRKANIVAPDQGGAAARQAELAPAPESGETVIPAQSVIRETLPMTRVGLHRQALRGHPDALIEKGDSISIHLRTAFLKDFEAIIGHPLRGFRPNGEIAIVVKAFEFGQGKDFKFGPDAVREGRLVYYSPDVDKGQSLNFNNLPVYGPITYQGNPIGIDISVIEIDANDAQVVALLGTLATIGGQAFPPAAPVLPVLNALGKALLNGDTNDTEMRFSMMLDPGAGYAGVSHPTVEAGDYVFVREEDRTVATPWHELEVDTNTGRVYRGDGPYAENSYLTFQINKNLSSTDIDLAENTFGDFLDELDKDDVERAEQLGDFLGELKKLGVARVQTRQFDEARDLLTEWKNAQQGGEEGKAKRAAFKLVALMQRAITAQDSATTTTLAPELSPEQINYLLDNLAVMADAGGGTTTDLQLFTPNRFKTAAFDDVFTAVQAGTS